MSLPTLTSKKYYYICDELPNPKIALQFDGTIAFLFTESKMISGNVHHRRINSIYEELQVSFPSEGFLFTAYREDKIFYLKDKNSGKTWKAMKIFPAVFFKNLHIGELYLEGDGVIKGIENETSSKYYYPIDELQNPSMSLNFIGTGAFLFTESGMISGEAHHNRIDEHHDGISVAFKGLFLDFIAYRENNVFFLKDKNSGKIWKAIKTHPVICFKYKNEWKRLFEANQLN